MISVMKKGRNSLSNLPPKNTSVGKQTLLPPLAKGGGQNNKRTKGLIDMSSYTLRSDLVQGTDQWHEWRKGKIGASSVAGIMGLSPYATKLQTWEKFKFNTSTDQNAAMKRGNDLEETARKKLNELTGIPFAPMCIEHSEISWCIASLDGFYQDPAGKIFAAEIKCPGRRDHQTALEGHVPEHYYPQLQHIMALLHIDKMAYYSFDGEEGVLIWVKRDDVFIEAMIKAEADFIHSVRDFKPPEPCDDDWITSLDENAIYAANRYKEIQDIEDELELEKLALKEILISQGHPRIKIGKVKVQKIKKRGHVDYMKIDLLKGIDLDPYRKPDSECWRIY